MLKKNKIKFSILLIGIAACLTACSDPIPDLSQEQINLIAEYSAGQLLKYSENYTGKIISDEAVAKELEREALFAKNTEEATIKTNEEKKEEQEESNEKAQETMNADIASFLGLSPVEVIYHGYEICDSYPSGADELYFTMDASPGKKLVVFKFLIQNNSAEEQFVDILSAGARFKVKMEETEKSVLTTMLLNDLSGFKENILPQTSAEAVLVVEMPDGQAEQLQPPFTLNMRIGDEKAQTVLN